MTSGAVAQLLQAEPRLTPSEVKFILQYTAQTRHYDALTQGAGFLNAQGAIELARYFRNPQQGQQYPHSWLWSRQIIWGDHRKELSGGEAQTTNNRMELMAAISALEALKTGVEADLYTDSAYVRNGISGWIHGWKRNGWKTADKKPVKNVELWQRLEQAMAQHKVTWHWIKGHAGHPENERADELARQGMAEFKPKR